MSLLLSTRRALIGGSGSYDDLVMGTGPIAYWPQSETAGTTAACLTDPAMNGAYTGVTLANDLTGPFGTPAPYYDGVNDVCDIFTAAFDAAFNGATGAAMIWCKVNAVGVWTDAALRYGWRIVDDANNQGSFAKTGVNNTIQPLFEAGGGTASVNHAPVTTTDWFCVIQTWSDSNNADEFKGFLDAVQIGATSAALNAWGGAGLTAAATVIGGLNNTPVNPWHGWLGPGAIWGRALPLAEVAALSLA